ncbi:MAG TPA: SOS response-associated peptidase [Acidimicrobiales bacterium]|nr:SOS response-associated peptidase [Acidimicrobiales bacterium]
MCGRFVATTPPDQLADYFAAQLRAETLLEPAYNVAPTRQVYTVLVDGDVRAVDLTRWGLVPGWAKDVSIGNRMINARAETLATKNAFKGPLRRRRCIIPVDGFYEWTVVPGQKKKQPWYIHRPDGEPYAFAGLWEVWRGPERDQEPLRSSTIITTEANEPMRELHDRMPVILPPSAWDTWLDPQVDDVELLGSLLVPAPPELVTFHPVSTEVNDARNRGEHLVDPVDPPGDGAAS